MRHNCFSFADFQTSHEAPICLDGLQAYQNVGKEHVITVHTFLCKYIHGGRLVRSKTLHITLPNGKESVSAPPPRKNIPQGKSAMTFHGRII